MINLVLSEKNQKKLDVIEAVVEGKSTVDDAASLLNISRRQIYRLLAQYKQDGKAAFVHGSTGCKSQNAFSREKKQAVAEIYKNKYFDIGFGKARRLMAKNDNISIGETMFSKIMHEFGITPPRLRWRCKTGFKAVEQQAKHTDRHCDKSMIGRKKSIKSAVESVIGKLSANKVSWDNKNCLVFVVPCPAGFAPEGGL